MDGDGEVSPATVRVPLLPLWWKHPWEVGIQMGMGRSGAEGILQVLEGFNGC